MKFTIHLPWLHGKCTKYLLSLLLELFVSVLLNKCCRYFRNVLNPEFKYLKFSADYAS